MSLLPGPSPASAERVFVGLGANLGDTAAALASALSALSALPGTCLIAVSSTYRSAPVDAQGPDFLNAVAELRTALEPVALLAGLHDIEHRHGRQRGERNAPRTLDLDLLLYGERRIDGAALVLPHPRLTARAFVLAPLAELAPGLQVPGQGAVAALLEAVRGQRVERVDVGVVPPTIAAAARHGGTAAGALRTLDSP